MTSQVFENNVLPSTSGRFHTTKKNIITQLCRRLKISAKKYNSKFSHYLQYTHAYLVVASQVIKRKSNGGKKKHTPKTFEKNFVKSISRKFP